MAFPKEQRNKEFLEAWRNGASNRALGERFALSVGGVKALKHRLRQASTTTSPSTSAAPSTSTSTKRMTFWLPEEMIEEIKRKASAERRTSSDILREILRKQLR